MLEKHDSASSQTRMHSSVLFVPVSRKQITWFSVVSCLFLLLVLLLAVIPGSPIHAAQATHKPTSAKHTFSPARVGRSGPVMSVSPLSLHFSQSLAQAGVPAGQQVTITNNGRRALVWHCSSASVAWETVAPLHGGIGVGQNAIVMVTVNPAHLSVGTYNTQIVLIGTDQHGAVAAGSPQTISVVLTVTV